MKRILFLLLALVLLCGAADAYILVIDAPDELQAGVPLLVTGNTTFPVGTQFDIILYKLQFTAPEEIGRRVIIVDESKTFDASFATTSLVPGQYKVEIQFIDTLASSKLGSGSTTVKVVDLVDRSKEIYLTAPLNQTLPDALRIEGYIPDFGVATITLRISGPEGFSLPDQYVRTTTELGRNDGLFAKSVNVTGPGNYYVNFYDQKGFITQVIYSVALPLPVTPTPEVPEGTLPAPTVSPGLPFPLAGLIGGMVAAGFFAWRRRAP
jgi:hypothetical protein